MSACLMGSKSVFSSCALIACLALGLAGCALTPAGTRQARDQAADAGKPYQKAFSERSLPALPAKPDWQATLHRALLANGELEAAYFDWLAAVRRIQVASSWPDSNLTLGFSQMLDNGRIKSFDGTTFSAGFPMKKISFPTKAQQAGRVALDQALAAGQRFAEVKFALQQQVLSTWSDYAFLAEKERLLGEDVGLLKMGLAAAKAQVQAGGEQGDLLQAQADLTLGEDALQKTQADVRAARAALNGMLAYGPDHRLPAPHPYPAPRPLVADDGAILAASVAKNPRLAALVQQVKGRQDALKLARMQWIPDLTPSASISGAMVEMIGAGVMLPTTVAAIRGGIDEADALQKGAEATLRQAKYDQAARLVAALVMLRDDERQAQLYETRLLPVLGLASDEAVNTYAAGRGDYAKVITRQRGLLMVRLAVAKARTDREKKLAELEALAGVDMETLDSSLKK